jgi:uncharacterized protein
MRIAIVGSGVSGLVCAHLLHPLHEITLFEAQDRLGGHVNTVRVPAGDAPDLAIDTGFIVFNEANYPGFTRLLERLGIASQPSDMSFSYSCMQTGLEYRATDFNTLFAQRRNLVNPGFLRMLVDITRFNRDARRLLRSEDVTTSLDGFLAAGRYSSDFVERYVTPLGSSIWSADPSRFGEFPAAALARFFDRHGLLRLRDRPEWRTVQGGASRYVEALVAPMRDRIRLGAPVHRIARDETGVRIWAGDGTVGAGYDAVVIAAHADQALRMLEAPSALEAETLGAFRFQPNRATLHTDVAMLPRNHRAWASWNYQRVAREQRSPTLTYNANSLQSLRSDRVYCTTLNREDDIEPDDVIASFDYAHPVFDARALRMQSRQAVLNGREHTYYCGAYWGYGFHEDGVQSALRVTRELGADL